MARLTEEMVIARSKQSDLSSVKKLNCWGAELGDVSLIRQMPNVEVLALSINKIRTLDVFTNCRRLRELYVRKNEIRCLSEIRHLRHLPELTSLWLEENPCTEHPEYRMTVLRNLPRLEKLDNQPVSADELAEAERRGHHIPDSDDEGYPQQESYTQYRSARSIESSPDREPEYIPTHTQSRHEGSDCSEPGVDPAPEKNNIQPVQSPGEGRRPSRASPDSDERFEHPAMTRSVYEPRGNRSPDASLRHSFSAQSVKDYSYSSNGDCRYSGEGRGGGGVTSPPYHDPYYEKPERSESYQQVPQRCPAEWEQDRASVRERDREYPSAVMAEHRGFTRRPVARNSNLLSAVLCLVKELDYPSLEVAEMAVSAGTLANNMAPPSSSGSWDGAGADIIDLDRYMRGSVRPSRAISEENQHGEQLVVDCGKPNVDITTTRYKHYSHDSGVSDGSYRQRRTRRPHRRPSNPSSPPTTYREPATAASATPRTPQRSSDSLRQFRTACEQVLVDQQKQIARVAEVCERLERAENGRTTEAQSSAQIEPVKPKEERSERRTEISERQSVKSRTSSKVKSCAEKKKMEVIVSRQSSETSDLSSSTSRSSGSDRNVRKTDKHRTSYAEECKTYKIIMRKLDELNHRFGPQQRARRPPSSSSVSVCDKLVATDPTPRQAKVVQAYDPVAKEHLSRSRVVQDSAVPPVEAQKGIGVKERIITTNNFSVKYESSSCRSNAGEEYPSLSPFDLNDPMRLYAQAKNLQAMAATATTRRTHSVDVDSRTPDQKTDAADRQFSRTMPSARSRSRSERDRSPSLCAVCRAYLRSLRQCLIAPLTDYKEAT